MLKIPANFITKYTYVVLGGAITALILNSAFIAAVQGLSLLGLLFIERDQNKKIKNDIIIKNHADTELKSKE